MYNYLMYHVYKEFVDTSKPRSPPLKAFRCATLVKTTAFIFFTRYGLGIPGRLVCVAWMQYLSPDRKLS